jgi:DNA-3-methyladenine glycosylase
MEHVLALPALEAAPQVLGMRLVYDSPQGRMAGIIVEVEAYRQDDPASHSFRPRTPRTEALFGPPGTVYIYFIYGLHYCINIVLGNAQALLIRAVEPTEGIEFMQRRRDQQDIKKLCNGPAKLVQAFGIPKTVNGTTFFTGPVRLEEGRRIPANQIVAGPRIGISKATDKHWRFYAKESPFVS